MGCFLGSDRYEGVVQASDYWVLCWVSARRFILAADWILISMNAAKVYIRDPGGTTYTYGTMLDVDKNDNTAFVSFGHDVEFDGVEHKRNSLAWVPLETVTLDTEQDKCPACYRRF